MFAKLGISDVEDPLSVGGGLVVNSTVTVLAVVFLGSSFICLGYHMPLPLGSINEVSDVRWHTRKFEDSAAHMLALDRLCEAGGFFRGKFGLEFDELKTCEVGRDRCDLLGSVMGLSWFCPELRHSWKLCVL